LAKNSLTPIRWDTQTILKSLWEGPVTICLKSGTEVYCFQTHITINQKQLGTITGTAFPKKGMLQSKKDTGRIEPQRLRGNAPVFAVLLCIVFKEILCDNF